MSVVSAIAAFVSHVANAAEQAPAMIVPGQFNVSQTGAATYTIPISVPPGTVGMVPALSLNYSSQSGDGLEGIGWTLSGLSSISRCPRTLAQDGVHGSVNYDANDRFCLDGQRLMLVSGSYGIDGSTYRTEIDSFSNIIAHGSSTPGVGPQWFEVHTKSGQIMQFGNSVDSQILVVYPGAGPSPTPRAWAVNKISDTVGNYLTVTYNCAPASGSCTDADRITYGEAYPLKIDYTANDAAGVPAYNRVTFVYTPPTGMPGARQDTLPLYQAGGITQTTRLLTDIKTYINTSTTNQLVYDYQLSYRAGTSTTHSRLTSVALCDGGSPQKCLNSTTFTWQGGAGYLTMTGTSNTATQNHDAIPLDINNDGITDVLNLIAGTSSCPPFYIYLGPSFTPSTDYSIPSPAPGAMSCYVNGAVQTIIAPNGAAEVIYPTEATYSPTDFATYVTLFGTNGPNNLVTTTQSYPAPPVFAGDFNGDGIPDYFVQQNPASYIYIGSTSGMFTADGGHTGFNPATTSVGTADFDGDGCIDLYSQTGTAATVTYAYHCNPATSTASAPFASGYYAVFGDFNGDGKTDVLFVSSTSAAQLWLSTGTGFTEVSSGTLPSDWAKYTIYAGDWNGDGKADLLLIAGGAGGCVAGTGCYGSTTQHQLWLSTGTGFAPAVDSMGGQILISNGAVSPRASIGDWNSDGATDFWLKQAEGDILYTFSYTPELITAISNGVGSTINVSYAPLNTNGTFYVKGTSATYPTQDIDGALYVVSREDASNGLGACNPAVSYANCYSSTYSYAGAQTDLQGRGFLGFTSMSVLDVQTLITQTTTYSTSFPFIGMVLSQTKTYMPAGVVLNSITNAPGDDMACDSSYIAPGNGIYIVCLTQTATASNDLNGAAFPTTTTVYSYDQFGNALTVNVAVTYGGSTSSTKNTANTYTNDTTNWFLGRLTCAAVQSVTGSSNLTRYSAFTYVPATGLLSTETIEPNNPGCGSGSSANTVTTSYGYDGFGHRTSTQVSGIGITTRTSYAAYDSRGEFQTSATNALGQQESWTYDQRFGSPSAHTGPNQLSTFWSYDTFGRRVLETRPDGTETGTGYSYCTGGCPAMGQFYAQSEIYAPGGSTQVGPVSVSFYDMLSRAIASDTQGFGGSYIRVETDYDANGRVHQTSRPYFTSGGTPEFTVFSYDALGRVLQTTFPDSSQTSYVFNGLVTSVTNNLSQTTTTTKNPQGLIASVQDAAGKITSYVYDAFGNVLTITDPAGNVVQNFYDIRGNKYQSDDPDLGIWMYAHDVLGELTSQTDAKSQTTTLTYDLLGRALTRSEVGLYSAWTYGTSASAHNVGQLIEAKACPDSSCAGVVSDRTITYDNLGRPASSQLAAPTGAFGYVTSYNASNGKIAAIAHPSGFIEKSTYNQYGYLCLITDNSGTPACGNAGGAAVFVTVNTRDAELHLTQSTAGNGVVTNQSFSATTGLIQTQTAGTGSSVANFAYTFDTIGNLTARTDNIESYTENFCYDGLMNRLVNYNTGGSCMGGKTIAYDPAGLGNIASKSDVGTYAYPASGPESVLPHAVTSIAGTVDGLTNPQYSYDGNGNLTCISTGPACSGTVAKQIALTSFNMAASITQGSTSVALSYDSEHKRLVQTSMVSGETTTTTYVNDPVSGAMAENIVTGGVPSWRDYVVVDGAIVAARTAGGGPVWGTAVWGQFTWGAATTSWAYFVLDHLGSVAVITDGSGAVTERLSYDPWGKRRNANGTDAACGTISSTQTRGFTNQEELDQVCFVNLNARIYDPSIGKFLSADPVVGNIYLPNAFNRYAYVLNNPLSFTDTSGLCFLGCFWTSPIFGAALDIGLFFVAPYAESLTLFGASGLFAQAAAFNMEAIGILSANAAIAGGVSAGVTGGNVLKGAAFGALGGALTAGLAPQIAGPLGTALAGAGIDASTASTAGMILAQGIAGGITSAAQGGNFGSGFLAGGVGSLAGPLGISGGQFDPANLIASAVLGGVASELGGGKFANGAITGAFAYLATHFGDSTIQGKIVGRTAFEAATDGGPPADPVPDHLEIVPGADYTHGTQLTAYYQLYNAEDALLSGSTYSVSESTQVEINTTGLGFGNSNGQFVPIRGGFVFDYIGVPNGFIVPTGTNGIIVVDQTFAVRYNGLDYSLRT